MFKLVEKSLTSKHPQLMLRRTESIVEKMLTNWLALAMYDYMKDYAGSSLFVLFKAIKFQVCVYPQLSIALYYSCYPCETVRVRSCCVRVPKSSNHVMSFEKYFLSLLNLIREMLYLPFKCNKIFIDTTKHCRCSIIIYFKSLTQHLILEMYKNSQHESCQNIFVLK